MFSKIITVDPYPAIFLNPRKFDKYFLPGSNCVNNKVFPVPAPAVGPVRIVSTVIASH